MQQNQTDISDQKCQAELALAAEWLKRNFAVGFSDKSSQNWLILALDGASLGKIADFDCIAAPPHRILVMSGMRAASLGFAVEPRLFLAEIPVQNLVFPDFAEEIQKNTPSQVLLDWLQAHESANPPDNVKAAAELALKLGDATELMPQFLLAPYADFVGAGLDQERGVLRLSPALSAWLAHQDTPALRPILQKIEPSSVPLLNAPNTQIIGWRDKIRGGEHLSLIIGNINPSEPILTRVHSSCLTGDALGSRRCDCGEQLQGALSLMSAEPKGGVIIYLAQEGRGIGLINKLRSYHLQSNGMDTIDANHHLGFAADRRDYRIAAAILEQMGIHRIRLLSNNLSKMQRVEAAARAINSPLQITERVSHKFPPNPHNQNYLATKKIRAGHDL